jgi:hypothetical protein
MKSAPREPGVAAAAPLVPFEGMLRSGRDLLGAMVVNGVDPDLGGRRWPAAG